MFFINSPRIVSLIVIHSCFVSLSSNPYFFPSFDTMNNYFFGGQAHSEFEQEPLHFDTDQPSAAFLDHAFQHSSHGSLMLNHENHSGKSYHGHR
jgi:hypothetical protein